jgi:hypothetical protein
MNVNDLKEYQKKERTYEIHLFRRFDSNTTPGAGFSFEVDQDGVAIGIDANEARLANWRGCISGEFDVTDQGVVEEEWIIDVPASGVCSCGERVELTDGLENYCSKCGTCYNLSGQKVLGRAAWERAGGSSLAGEVWDEEA